MDINNNHFNNVNDQNQQERPGSTLTPKIPGYFQSLTYTTPTHHPKNSFHNHKPDSKH